MFFVKKIFITITLAFSIISVSIPAFAQTNYWDPRPIPEDEQKQPKVNLATTRIIAPPKMPATAKESGFCCMIYDVTDKGLPDKVNATFCSAKMFKEPSIESVKKWRFNPAISNGKNTRAYNQFKLISFRLTNPDGSIIPDSNRLILNNGTIDFSSKHLCHALNVS